MALGLFDAKSLSDRIETYNETDPRQQILAKLESKVNDFLSVKYVWKRSPQNGGHFVLASMY